MSVKILPFLVLRCTWDMGGVFHLNGVGECIWYNLTEL